MELNPDSRILLTGASGFVGQSLLDYLASNSKLAAKEICVVGLRNLPEIPNTLKEKYSISFFQADLTDTWHFSEDYSHLIHLAGDGTHDPYTVASGKKFQHITENAAAWLKDREISVFHASSGAVNGYFPISPNPFNTWNKKDFKYFRQSAEEIMLQTNSNLADTRIGRLYSFIGPRILSKSQYAITQFITGARENKIVKLNGDPATERSYLSSSDLSEWILSSFKAEKGSVLQIGSSKPVSIMELAQYIAQKTNSQIDLPESFTSGDRYIANNLDTMRILEVTETQSWNFQVDDVLGQFE